MTQSSNNPPQPVTNNTATQRIIELDELVQRWVKDNCHEEITTHYTEILSLADQCQDEKVLARLFNTYGKYFYRVGKFDNAFLAMHRALDYARKIGNQVQVGALLNNIGSVFRVRGFFKEALENFELARKEFVTLGERGGIALATGNIAIVYVETEQQSKSIPYFLEAIELFRELGRKEDEANYLGDYAKVLMHLDQPDHAIKAAEQAYALIADSPDDYTKGTILNSLGLVYSRYNRYEDAKAALEQALAIHRTTHNQRFIGVTCTNLGFLARTMNNDDEAIEYFQKATIIQKEIGDIRGETISLWNTVRVYLNQHRWTECLPILTHITETTPGYKDHILSIEAILLLAEVYRHLGNAEEALATTEIVEGMLSEFEPGLIGITISYRALLCLDQNDLTGADKLLVKAHNVLTPEAPEAKAMYWIVRTLYWYTIVTSASLTASGDLPNHTIQQSGEDNREAIAALQDSYREELAATDINTVLLGDLLIIHHNELQTKLSALGIQ